MGSSRVVRSLLVAAALGAGFAACAQGAQLGMGGTGGQITTTGGSDGGKVEAGPPPGGIGSPCPDGQCASGTCTLVGNDKYCTTSCPPTCPQGTHCSIVSGNSICVPDLDQCATCGTSADCKLPSSACLVAPLGDSFCAQDCTVDGMCPNGFVCTSKTAYAGLDAGAPDGGGAHDAGAGDAGAGDGGKGDGGTHDGGANDGGAGDGGTGADAGVPSAADMWCVPDDGASCPCTSARDGVTNTCFVTNSNGTCAGMETCSGEAAAWTGCTAMTPGPEICNGKDDNCDGQTDNGNPNALCAGMGPPPPNGNWACTNAMCKLGTCQPGWTAYPTSNATTGCNCAVDADEPNGTCAQATAMGTVSSTSTTPIILTGTLSSDTDVDVYSFMSTDPNPSGTNPYHVSIAFTAPTSNTEFVMDVIRGTVCTDTPTGGAINITSYDWCVNGMGMVAGAVVGEAPCGPTTPNVPHCADHSSKYFVRVHRAAAMMGTCAQYSITVTGSGGTCDVTQTCQ
jgi:hypothetical protein